MVVLKGLAAASNCSACKSRSYQPSHVLKAMGLSNAQIAEAVQISWCHMTPILTGRRLPPGSKAYSDRG